MVSQGSFCDSDGVPGYMQDGSDGQCLLEEGQILGEENPILIAGSVFSEIMTKKTADFGASSHLEVNPQEDDGFVHRRVLKENERLEVGGNSQRVRSGVLGGIPIVASEEEEGSEREEEGSEREEGDDVSPQFTAVHEVAKVAFAINKREREELIAIRMRLMELQQYMEANGLPVAVFDKKLMVSKDEFNRGLPEQLALIQGRDEFGLPIFKNVNKVSQEAGTSKAHPPSKLVQGEGTVKQKTWSSVVKDTSEGKKEVKFKYFPLEPGVKVVSPPEEVLKKGVDKMRCVVGTFTRGFLPFKLVVEKAKRMWERGGLVKVSQKGPKQFIFRFDTLEHKVAVLSKGTWYFGSKPVVLTDWGSNSSDTVSSLPVWIKMSNIPDCYWTDDGLASLASAVGKPI